MASVEQLRAIVQEHRDRSENARSDLERDLAERSIRFYTAAIEETLRIRKEMPEPGDRVIVTSRRAKLPQGTEATVVALRLSGFDVPMRPLAFDPRPYDVQVWDVRGPKAFFARVRLDGGREVNISANAIGILSS